MAQLGFRAQSRAIACAAAVCVAAACSSSSPTDATPAPAANTVTFGSSKATVKLAATNAARTQGLMGVTKLAADSGMLFVYADDRLRAFWMKDTPIPLSIAFLDANKKVVFLAEMPANTTMTYGGLNAPLMRYALEMNQGWFTSHGITVGTYATFSLPTGLVIEAEP